MLLKFIASKTSKDQKLGRAKKTTFCQENDTRSGRRFACRLYPSHGPLRFITSHSRFALASAMRKTKRLRRRLYLALLEWRNTPSEGLQSPPAQRMFGRRTRTLIPTTSELLKPKIVDDVSGKLFKRKQLQAKYYNISAKELLPLNNGEVVCVKPTDKSGRWYKVRVEK